MYTCSFYRPQRGSLCCHDLCLRILNQTSLLVSLPLAAVLPRRLRPFHTHVRFKQCSVFVVVILVCRFCTSAYNNLQQHGQKPNGVISYSLKLTSAIVRHSPSATIYARRLPWGHPSLEHDTFPTLMAVPHSHVNVLLRRGTLPGWFAPHPPRAPSPNLPQAGFTGADKVGSVPVPVKKMASTLLCRE